ncbi:MAG TPA: ABC transporter permease [Gemmatimonadaceae bacterium]|jgi:Acidobacterial duplicated orphan permease
MRILAFLRSLWIGLAQRRRAERSLDDEVRAWVDLLAAEYERAGMAPSEARRRALVETGGIEQVKEATRDARVGEGIATVVRDLRFALRSLTRSPGFTIAAVVTIALGIGATTVVFSAVNRVLLHPLPFEGGERMFYLWLGSDKYSFMLTPSAPVVDAWQRDAHSFEALESYSDEPLYWSNGDDEKKLHGVRVSPGFLRFFGLSPALGRMFAPDEVVPGGPRVALLGYGFWQRAVGGRPDVVGSSVWLRDGVYDIIGVMPRRVAYFDDAEIWLPQLAPSANDSTVQNYQVIGKLRAGVTPAVAQRELEAIASRIPSSGPERWRARVVEPDYFTSRSLKSGLPLLLGAVAFVLLIACTNVALLLLARGRVRERELAIRLALGAGRGRLVWQLLLESAVLALAGGALATLITWWGLGVLDGVLTESLSALSHTAVDLHVLLFAVLSTAGAALFVGVVPAIRSTALAPGATLRGSAPGEGGRHGRGLHDLLIAGEVMLSVMLLVGAGLMVRSMIELQRADLGFRPEGLLSVGVSLPREHYPTAALRQELAGRLIKRVRALSGVRAATIASGAPPDYNGVTGFNGVQVEGDDPLAGGLSTVAMNIVHSDYFKVVGTRMLEGRTFAQSELRHEQDAIVLSKGLAERLSPGRSLVGRRLRFAPQAPWLTVVGITEDVVAGSMSGSTRHYQSYSPYYDGPATDSSYVPRSMFVVVRTRGDASAMITTMRGVVHDIDPEIPPPEIATAESRLARMLTLPKFNTVALTLFAVLALVLASVGLFGVLSYTVARRTREIGVRVALGALDGDVRALVVRQGMLPALLGLLLGSGAAFFTTRLLSSLLYGVTPRDALSFVAAAIALIVTALAACYIPARRATRIDPMTALRSE